MNGEQFGRENKQNTATRFALHPPGLDKCCTQIPLKAKSKIRLKLSLGA
jgi:hypothetical protein